MKRIKLEASNVLKSLFLQEIDINEVTTKEVALSKDKKQHVSEITRPKSCK